MSVVETGREYTANVLGLVLVNARHAASLRGFGFQRVNADLSDESTQWRLHIQCPWRVCRGGTILTGSEDWFTHVNDEINVADGWDPAKGGSLQTARLQQLFAAYGASGLSFAVANPLLAVESVMLSELGDLTLTLAGGVALHVFPAASRDESWRLFDASDESSSFVWATA